MPFLKSPVAEKLAALRHEMRQHNLDAVVISKNDAHRLEYSEIRDNGIFFLSGFDGSAGMLAVTANSGQEPKAENETETAAVFVDGRYHLQVRDQVDAMHFEYEDLSLAGIATWLGTKLSSKARVGFAAEKFSIREIDRFKTLLSSYQLDCTIMDSDLSLEIWEDRPQRDTPQIQAHPLEYTGQDHENKIKSLREEMTKEGATLCCLNAIESVAWLCNIRAPERAYLPAPDAFALVPLEGKIKVYLDHDILEGKTKQHLEGAADVHAYDTYFEDLKKYSNGQQVLLDPIQNSMKEYFCIKDTCEKVVFASDPTVQPRACKTAAEIEGAQKAHVVDACAIVKTLAWIEGIYCADTPKSVMTEMDVVAYLSEARGAHQDYRGASFETISGSGPNGAIVHYRVTPESNRTLNAGDIFLLDSGGQYPYGTTDITRTLYLGSSAPQEFKRDYTLVLKGHLALSRQTFPVGTTGSKLDPVARQFLWNHGMDFAHGTGHGVGAFLGVHEGPQRISPLHNDVALAPGMILSNEPGYYVTDSHGIRIENLIYVVPSAQEGFLAFKTLTLAPYSKTLIDPALLNETEINEINEYHAQVYATLKDQLSGGALKWLEHACQAL